MNSERRLVFLLITSVIVKVVIFAASIVGAMDFSLPFSEAWKDYLYAYVPSVQAFTSGYMPYRDFYHAYPPLFLYVLSLFSFVPCPWSMAVPLIASDALTVVPVYLIGKGLLGERGGLVSALLFVLAPLNLFYVDYLWLNPPLTTFFLLLSVCSLLQRRYDLSASLLAISIGFKQTALLALPVVLFFVWRKGSRGNALKYFGIVASICFVFSIPYILVAPELYLSSIFRVPIPYGSQLPDNYFLLSFTNPPGATGVSTETLDWFMQRWTNYGVPLTAPENLLLPVFVFLFPGMSPEAYFNSGWVLKVFFFIGYGLLLYKTHRIKQFQNGTLIKYLLYAMLVFFTFNSLYKYYVAGITPFLTLLVTKRRDLIAFSSFNLIMLVIPRILAPYMLLLLLGALLVTGSESNRQARAIKQSTLVVGGGQLVRPTRFEPANYRIRTLRAFDPVRSRFLALHRAQASQATTACQLHCPRVECPMECS